MSVSGTFMPKATSLESLQNEVSYPITECYSKLQWVDGRIMNKYKMEHSSVYWRANIKVNGHRSFQGRTKIKLLCTIALLMQGPFHWDYTSSSVNGFKYRSEN